MTTPTIPPLPWTLDLSPASISIVTAKDRLPDAPPGVLALLDSPDWKLGLSVARYAIRLPNQDYPARTDGIFADIHTGSGAANERWWVVDGYASRPKGFGAQFNHLHSYPTLDEALHALLVWLAKAQAFVAYDPPRPPGIEPGTRVVFPNGREAIVEAFEEPDGQDRFQRVRVHLHDGPSLAGVDHIRFHGYGRATAPGHAVKPIATRIHANGSRMHGEAPATIDDLLRIMEQHELQPWSKASTGEDGTWRFEGNFVSLSHVFHIETNDRDVLQKLREAFRRQAEARVAKLSRRAQGCLVKQKLHEAGFPIRRVHWGAGSVRGWLYLGFTHGTPSSAQDQARRLAADVLGRRDDIHDGGDPISRQRISTYTLPSTTREA